MTFATSAFAGTDSANPYAPIGRFPHEAAQLLEEARDLGLIDAVGFRDFFKRVGDRADDYATRETVAEALVAADLLTPYQSERLQSGNTYGLMIGSYKVLEKVGGGTVGVVFAAEHTMLKRRVAIKVIPADDGYPPDVLERFNAEMRVLSNLRHPHIVTAYDAGVLQSPDTSQPTLHYLVMEYVGGGDLEQYLYAKNAPLDVPQCCDWMSQAAAGLQEAHDHHLIHRDLKPSNLLLTEDGKIKLVDFGLARQFASSLTEPTSLLGSLEFMAPEQSMNPTAVGEPADIYALGATMFWLLTGQTPFEITDDLVQMMETLQTGVPRRMRDFRPEIPADLDEFVHSMLARDPGLRPPTPIAVMNALARYATPGRGNAANTGEINLSGSMKMPVLEAFHYPEANSASARVLVVTPDMKTQNYLVNQLLPALGHHPVVGTAKDAVGKALMDHCQIAVIEHRANQLDGAAVCRRMRERPGLETLRVLILQHGATTRDLALGLDAGADEVLPWPIDPVLLDAKLRYLHNARSTHDHLTAYVTHLLTSQKQLEASLQAKMGDVRKTQDALIFAMAKLAEASDGETAGHQQRMRVYSVTLAEALRDDPAWVDVIERRFIETLERCVPLHDIGKLAIPDAILSKNGPLSPAERQLVESHPVVGANLLESISREYGASWSFLTMARAVVRHHHERFDGKGYPDRLIGEQIPPAARIVALADAYDALRRHRPHRPAMTHSDACAVLMQQSPGQFDPTVLRAFAAVSVKLDRAFHSIPG